MVIRLVGMGLVLVTAAGCQTLWKSTTNVGAATAVAQPATANPLAALPSALKPSSGRIGPVPQVNEQQALQQVLPQLQKLAATDPPAHAELLKQLSTTQPSLWALTAQRAIATTEYRQQIAAAKGVPNRASQVVVTRAAEPMTPPTSPATPLAKQPTFAPPGAPVVLESPAVIASHAPQVIENQHVATSPEAEPTPQEPTNIRLVSATSEPNQQIDRLPSTTSERSESPTDWRTSLDAAITVLQATVPATPHNTEEAYHHARLRLLQLAAGRKGEAVASVPGLPPTEQTYWSKQLYSISTLLDSSSQPDRQRRAAAAADHQAEASDQLRQLSSLSIKNLGFCTEVYGFGAYEPIDQPEFTAGQQATLYCEVDNYRSESTERGYHTSLATSYRIVDSHETLVDSGEFPLVEDHCLSLRHDFHIQYGVTLPTTVYPGEYRLELTVTDQLGNKIGEDSVAFEIVGK